MNSVLTIDESDRRFFLEEPDPGFHPEKNRLAIKKAIDSGFQIERDLRKATQKDMEYRVDLLSSYARSIASTGNSQRFENYVGRQHMARVYGEKLLAKIKIMESVERLNIMQGNTIEGGKFFLT